VSPGACLVSALHKSTSTMARVLDRLRSRPVLAAVVVGLAATGLLALALTAWLLPRLVRRTAEERLQARVTVPVRIERLNLNLFTGRARLSNVVIGAAGGGQPILTLPALDLGLSYRGLLRGRIVLRYLTFDGLRVFVERTGPESVNVLQMLRPSEGGAMAPVTLEQVTLRGGTVTFVDRTQRPAFERTFTGVEGTVGYLSTLPEFRFTPTSFEVRIGIGRGALTVAGNTAPFARPGGLELIARMEGLEPGLLRGYLPLRARIDLRGSRVDGEVRYRLAYRGSEVVENAVDASVETGPVKFLPLDDDTPLFGLAGLVGRDIHADFVTNRIRLGDVVVREPHARVVRGPAGLNLAQLIALEPEAGAAAGPSPTPPETRQAAPPRPDPAPPLSVLLGRVRAEGGSLDFSDQTTTPVVSTALRGIGLRVQDVSLGPPAKPGRLEGEAAVGGGTVRFDGPVEGGTLATRLRLRADRMGLEPFRPYVEPALRGASARGGVLDASLDVVLVPRDPTGSRLDMAGTGQVRDVALALPGEREPIVTTGRLAVELARLQVLPAFQADVTRIRLVGSALRVRRERDGGLNLQRLWAEPVAPAGPAAEPTGAARPVVIRRVELTGGRLDFTDASVSPAFTARLREVGVDVRQGPRDPERMTVRLRGRLGDAAPVEVGGWVTPFATPLRARVTGALRDYDLPALNPYVTHYVGQRVERGRITTEVTGSYDGGSYTADTRITIRHVLVGEEVDPEFHEGVGVPLKLAVSLLEGPDGEIRLDVPITGGAEGRQIHLRSVIATALRNTIVKTIEAPFRIFGKLLTQDGRIDEVRIDPVEFREGSLEPSDDASVRLTTVIDFLKSHPKLALKLRGVANPQEAESLKQERFKEALKKTPPVPDEPLVAVYRDAGGPAAKSPPPARDMERFVLDHMRIGPDDLTDLAAQRARVIQEALVRRGVEARRLYIGRPEDRAGQDGGSGRVEFELLY
jgi:Domain of Unknown Function (DUF748)